MKEIIVRNHNRCSSPEEIMTDISAETARIVKLTRALGTVAVVDSELHELLTVEATGLEKAATVLSEAVRSIEITTAETFGGEESYWTVYRMFVVGDNLGRPRNLADVWEYLAANYDMSHETIGSLRTTLFEWADDFVADAAQRGVRGSFASTGNDFFFAPSVQAREPVFTPIVTARPPMTVEYEAVEPAPTEMNDFSMTIVNHVSDAEDGAIKQAELKKRIVKDSTYEAFSAQEVQNEIDRLIETGLLYRFRRDKVAYLSRESRADEDAESVTSDPERALDMDQDFDATIALAILRVLAAPGTHVQRKVTLAELWREINGSDNKSQAAPDDELDALKLTGRQLQAMGIVVARSEKLGTGGVRTNSAVSSKRRRSSTRQVFKLGLADQEAKKHVRSLLERTDAQDRLETRYLEAVVDSTH